MLLGNVDGQVGVIGMNVREAYLYIVALALLGLDSHTVWRCAPDVVTELLHTVNIEFEMSASIYIHHVFTRFFGRKDSLVLSREVFQLYARSEVMHSERGNSQRLGIVLCRDGLTFHSTVVPESSFHSLLAIKATLRGHQTLHDFVISEVTALIIV